MPRRTDIESILVIGSGPIVIGQAAEFDYSGTQACRILRAEGYRVILVNSNPATIMTDPEFADATYIEPITPEFVEKVIAKERPDALLATLGGQTALNTAVALHDAGILDEYGVELIGADVEAIKRGEDRDEFKKVVDSFPDFSFGRAESARSRVCHSLAEIEAAAEELGLPVVLRPSFTMGGAGSGFAHDMAELRKLGQIGLDASPATEVLIEESVVGWKEIELELMRDSADNVIQICTIENFDPMGVHTGDSITVAPAMTLTEQELNNIREVGYAIIRGVGVKSGGCNIQFAINPDDGRMIVIEMNPRVSRSSALASKATGYPIAKIAAKVAVGYTLDEIQNDITGETTALDEPALDYVVVKVPRFAFEKFPLAEDTLTTHMKSVGEVMSLGGDFKEALGKALRSLEDAKAPFNFAATPPAKQELLAKIARPYDGRLADLGLAMRAGASVDELHEATLIDRWFLGQVKEIIDAGEDCRDVDELDAELLLRAKQNGLSDRQLADVRGVDETQIAELRHQLGIRPVFRAVDTAAGKYAERSNYRYSSYCGSSTVATREKPAVLILGAGPNRIGQGVEFDYSCVHAALELSSAGYESIMVNCNPETVSTDYDTSDRLYFEPLTFEDVTEIYAAECAAGPVAGVIVQLGGQTPLKLAQQLTAAGLPIIGTSADAIDLAEERGAFGEVLAAAGLIAPKHGMAASFEEAREIADQLGYPVLVRPSYVLGGRGMEIVYDEAALQQYIANSTLISAELPVLVDHFLDDAVELDVDALFDGEELYLGGVMEHIEEAGIHSGDSACSLPPVTLGSSEIDEIRRATAAIARGVGVRGLINIQYAVAGDIIYVLEANPRASRTVPFVSKATNTPLAKAATLIMVGKSIAELRESGMLRAQGDGANDWAGMPIAVKEAVLPFHRFHTAEGGNVDAVLGPEMRSTGEVMGLAGNFGEAFAKSQAAVYGALPTSGTVFVSVANRDKRNVIFPIKRLADLGFRVLATEGTASVLRRNNVPAETVRKHSAGSGPDGEPTITQLIADGEIDLIFNTPTGKTKGGDPREDGYQIRTQAVLHQVPIITTVQGLAAAVSGMDAMITGEVTVRPLQSWADEISAHVG